MFFLVTIILGDIMRILITGSSSGIGYSLGRQLVYNGHTVYFTARTNEELNTLKKKLRDLKIDALSFKMDITTDDINLVDSLKIDCLICNAAVGIGGSLLYMDTEYLRQNYEVNVFSNINLIKKVYSNMEKDKIKGKIVVLSSISYMINFPFLGSYTSSKAALSSLIKTLKRELEYLDNGIKIYLVELGAYKTGFNQVMIDNKSKYLETNNKIYNNLDSINRLQRNLFSLIESKSFDLLNKRIINCIEKNKNTFCIRMPYIQQFLVKIYFVFH